MASLLNSIQSNNANLAVNTPPTFVMPSKPSSQEIPPAAKSTLLAGSMCGILGGVWAAPPKFDAKKLIDMNNDTFEHATTNVKKKCPQELEAFRSLRSAIKNKIDDSLVSFLIAKKKFPKLNYLKSSTKQI